LKPSEDPSVLPERVVDLGGMAGWRVGIHARHRQHFTKPERSRGDWRDRKLQLSCRAMILEIRAAEGGDDAKLLVIEQWKVYQRVIELEGL
jgi:hypothetical protein